MATLYGIDLDQQAVTWSFASAGVPIGWIDWLGGGYILHGGTTNLNVFRADSGAIDHIRTLLTLGSTPDENCRGIAANHTRNELDQDEDAGHGFDANQAFIIIREEDTETEPATIIYYLYLWDHISGNIVRRQTTLTTSETPIDEDYSGIMFDGHFLWLNATNKETVGRLIQQIDPATGKVVKTWAPSTDYLDLCFDGQFAYALDSTNITKFEVSDWTKPQISFAHGISGANSFTFDGRQFMVLGT